MPQNHPISLKADNERPSVQADQAHSPVVHSRHKHPSKPHRPAHHGFLRVINAVSRLLLSNGSSLLRLDEAALLDKACEETGLNDFGDDSFRLPLKILLASLVSDADLNLIGRICVRSDILRMLCNRLRLVADSERHPKIEDVSIRRPIFITGLPRSGTTLLHALLAQDPASRAPQVWEVMHPSPPPARSSYASDPRILQTEKELRWLKVIMPDFETVHLMNARLPQECIAITGHAFRSNVFESMYHVWSYRSWLDSDDKRPAYDFHRRFLQHLQWRCPGTHWVLKAPSHLLALDVLLQVYPDARIIMTHRDPLKVLASCASFTEVLRRPFTHSIDRKMLGPEIKKRWEAGAGLAVKFSQSDKILEGGSFDVRYSDLIEDPMAVVRRIYTRFDMQLTDEALLAMERFLTENPQNKKGVHRYSLEDYGLDADTVRRSFGFYTDHFGIDME